MVNGVENGIRTNISYLLSLIGFLREKYRECLANQYLRRGRGPKGVLDTLFRKPPHSRPLMGRTGWGWVRGNRHGPSEFTMEGPASTPTDPDVEPSPPQSHHTVLKKPVCTSGS